MRQGTATITITTRAFKGAYGQHLSYCSIWHQGRGGYVLHRRHYVHPTEDSVDRLAKLVQSNNFEIELRAGGWEAIKRIEQIKAEDAPESFQPFLAWDRVGQTIVRVVGQTYACYRLEDGMLTFCSDLTRNIPEDAMEALTAQQADDSATDDIRYGGCQ